jgi:hypothetical protein
MGAMALKRCRTENLERLAQRYSDQLEYQNIMADPELNAP